MHRSTGVIHTVLGGVGGKYDFDLAVFEVMEGVKEAHRIVSPYKLASRSFRPAGTIVQVGASKSAAMPSSSWPGRAAWRIAIRSSSAAEIAARAGARVIRGGAFKPQQFAL